MILTYTDSAQVALLFCAGTVMVKVTRVQTAYGNLEWQIDSVIKDLLEYSYLYNIDRQTMFGKSIMMAGFAKWALLRSDLQTFVLEPCT